MKGNRLAVAVEQLGWGGFGDRRIGGNVGLIHGGGVALGLMGEFAVAGELLLGEET